jgi:hypothetical protein
MHNDIDDAMEENGTSSIPPSALLAISKARLLDSTLIVLCSEFGRGPKINRRMADAITTRRSSAPSLPVAGVKGGFIYGASDKAATVADKQTSIQDFHATIGHASWA